VIGIDEAQFFDKDRRRRASRWRSGGSVVVAGLDTDYLARPFEPMPHLMAIAEYVTKTHAICMVCGNPGQPYPAAGGQRRAPAAWGHREYEARCRHCFDPTLAQTGGTPRHETSH
jgi:thymidine kinase